MSASFRMLCLLLMFFCPTLSHALEKDTTSILLFGDSIIAGYGLNAEEAMPVQLQNILQESHTGIKIVNGGVSGDTTAAGRNRLAWTLDKHRPSMVILALGGNDVLRGIPPELTRENLIAMLDLLKKREIPTILSAVQAPDNLGATYNKAFNTIYSDLAERYNVPLYPFLLKDTYGKNELMQADGIHPNAEGARHIAENLAKYLKQLPLMAKIGD